MGQMFIDAHEAYRQATINREEKYKDTITKIRLAIFKAIDEGETEFTMSGYIPPEIIDLLKARNYDVVQSTWRNETYYTITMKRL